VAETGSARAVSAAGWWQATVAPFSSPHFTKIWLGGLLWSICRWGLGFLGAYVVDQRLGSPRLVQLTGTFMWGPLLFAGSIGGMIADRFERRTIVLVQFGGLLPLATAVGAAAVTDRLPTWVIYPFMITVGVGWVIDMTARRALIYDLVGPEQVNGAMALEQFSSALGLALGALAGGAVIGFLGVGAAYLTVAGLMLLALVVLARLPRRYAAAPAAAAPSSGPGGAGGAGGSILRGVIDGFVAARRNRPLMSVLGVTLIVNVFHFAYFPIVSSIARRVDATPFLTGLLAASTGLGMATGAVISLVRRPRRGPAYVYGSFVGFAATLGFALFTSYPLVFLSLYVASVGVGVYGASQSALVLTSSDEAMRGRAMGLLSMAIGGLPIGMYLLGEFAQHVGAPWALVAFNVTGAVVLLVFLFRRPEVMHIT